MACLFRFMRSPGPRMTESIAARFLKECEKAQREYTLKIHQAYIDDVKARIQQSIDDHGYDRVTVRRFIDLAVSRDIWTPDGGERVFKRYDDKYAGR